MSVTKRIAFGAAASWFSRAVTILLGLLLMPVLFRHLVKEELGVWLLLGQSWAALGIFDLGFGVTLTRRIAFAKGKSGSEPNAPLTDETLREIADLVATGRRVYGALAVFAFVFSFGAGFFYLRTLDLSAVSLTNVWLAWAVLCFSQALMVWATVWTCLLQGVGYIGWEAILGSFMNALTVLAQIVVVLLGGGLVPLAAAAAAGALTQRFVMLSFTRRKRPELFALRGRYNAGLVRSMAPLAARAWLTALGASMILYSDQILIASLKGATELPAYRAAFMLVHNLTIAAVAVGVASGVFVSHLWQAGEIKQVHRIVERNVRFGWLVMLTGAAVLLCAGETIFNLWLGPGNFIGYGVLLVFLFYETLETQSYVIATASRATEDEAFAISAITAGLLKLGLSWWFATKLGLLGIALGTAVALLLTNHWYMAFRGLRRLRVSLRGYVLRIVVPCLLAFGVVTGVLFAVRAMVHNLSPLFQIFAISFVAIGLFGIAIWTLVLEPGQRTQVARAFGLNARVPPFSPQPP